MRGWIFLFIYLPHVSHRFIAQWSQFRGAAIISDLIGAFPAGNRASHRVGHQNPAQRELRHRCALQHQWPQLFHGFEARFVVNTGKSLAHIKGFAVPVEISVIVGSESRIQIELAGQQAARERHTRQDADLFSFASAKNRSAGRCRNS